VLVLLRSGKTTWSLRCCLIAPPTGTEDELALTLGCKFSCVLHDAPAAMQYRQVFMHNARKVLRTALVCSPLAGHFPYHSACHGLASQALQICVPIPKFIGGVCGLPYIGSQPSPPHACLLPLGIPNTWDPSTDQVFRTSASVRSLPCASKIWTKRLIEVET
jgi:hypothetical protein